MLPGDRTTAPGQSVAAVVSGNFGFPIWEMELLTVTAWYQ